MYVLTTSPISWFFRFFPVNWKNLWTPSSPSSAPTHSQISWRSGRSSGPNSPMRVLFRAKGH